MLVPLSARDDERLMAAAGNLLDFLTSDPRAKGLALKDIAYTLQVGREAMANRVVFLVRQTSELTENLEAFVRGERAGGKWWKGDVRENNVGNFFSDADGRNMVAGWAASGKRKRIAKLWAQGGTVDWHLLAGKTAPRRVHLPPYPFARERYRPEAKAIGVPTDKGLHPLVHANTSDLLEQRFTTFFTGLEFFLKDHVIQGRRVLPGVAYLEMAQRAFELSAGCLKPERPDGAVPQVRLRNIVWARPLVVGDHGAEIHIRLSQCRRRRARRGMRSIPIPRTAAGNLSCTVRGLPVLVSRRLCRTWTLLP